MTSSMVHYLITDWPKWPTSFNITSKHRSTVQQPGQVGIAHLKKNVHISSSAGFVCLVYQYLCNRSTLMLQVWAHWVLFCWFQEEQRKKQKGLVCKVTHNSATHTDLVHHDTTYIYIDFSTQNGMLTACCCNFQTLLFIILDVNQLEKVPQVFLLFFCLLKKSISIDFIFLHPRYSLSWVVNFHSL